MHARRPIDAARHQSRRHVDKMSNGLTPQVASSLPIVVYFLSVAIFYFLAVALHIVVVLQETCAKAER